jgi:hypothetical protein
METLIALVVGWWKVGLGIGGGALVLGVLWRWVLADLVLSTVELP